MGLVPLLGSVAMLYLRPSWYTLLIPLCLPSVARAPEARRLLREAAQTASGIADTEVKDFLLGDIAEVQAKVGDLQGALRTVGTISSYEMRGDTLTRSAGWLAERGDWKGALQAAKAIRPEYNEYNEWTSKSYTVAAIAMAKAGLWDRASAIAEALRHAQDGVYRDEILWDLASAQMAAGQVERALATADRIDAREMMTIMVWIKSAIVMARQGDQEGSAGLLQQAVHSAEFLRRHDVLIEIVSTEVQLGDMERALGVARRIAEPHRRDAALELIAVAQVERGHIDQAHGTANTVQSLERRDGILRVIATAQAKGGDLSGAKEMIRLINSNRHQAYALVELASGQVRWDDRVSAITSFQASIQAAKAGPVPVLWNIIAPSQARLGFCAAPS